MNRQRTLDRIQGVDARLELLLLWFVIFFLGTHGQTTLNEWLTSWNHWDAQWYQKILSPGYPTNDLKQLVFPPGYSLIVKALSSVFSSDFIRTAQVINGISFYGAGILACRVLKKYFKVDPTFLFASFLLLLPNYFIFTAYSDALFLFLFWLLIHTLVFHPERSASLFLISALVPWVRITGYAFFALILPKSGHSAKRWPVVLGLVLSLSGWLLFQKVHSGDFFYFVNIQKEFGVPDGGLWQGFIQAFGDFQISTRSILNHLGESSLAHIFSISGWAEFFSDPSKQKMFAVGFLPFTSFIFLSLVLIWCLVTGRSLVGLLGAAILILSHNQALWRSTVRYNWPLYMIGAAFLLHQMASHRGVAKVFWCIAGLLIFIFSFLLQLWYGHAFMRDGWAF